MEALPDPLRLLAAPIEQILTCGGDTRLGLDPVTRLNGYGCRPFPRPDAFTFSSSTATSISGRAYAAAAAARQDLRRDSAALGFRVAFEGHIGALRAELLRLLGLEGSGCDIVFSPSGTDAQLQATFLARALLGTPLATVIAASDETGSGTSFVAQGRHFNTMTADGRSVGKGEPIPGLAEGLESVAIPMRKPSGALRPYAETDADVTQAVALSLAAKKRVLLFAMDSSKCGLRSPSLDALDWIAAASGPDLQVVIDAAQMRSGRKRLARYLEQNFIVLITGSKFFTGAPFSGALILPPAVAARCREIATAPASLAAYSSASDWPLSCHGLRASLPGRANLGQWLRWVAALEEMRAYFAVPMSFREFALARFSDTLPRLLSAEDCLLPLQFEDQPAEGGEDEEFAARTIFPFLIRRNGQLLAREPATLLYRALNDDVAAFMPQTLPPMQRLLAARRCHIGQPVAIPDGRGGTAGALRISAGARFVSESWCDDMLVARENLRAEFDQVRAIIEKIRLLLRHFDDVAPAYEDKATRTNYQVNAA